MSKAPKKPKLAKLPKKPKQTASVEVWARYEQRAKDVVKRNNERIAAYNDAVKKVEKDKAKRKALIGSVGKMSNATAKFIK